MEVKDKDNETDPCFRSKATADLFPHQEKSCSKVLPHTDFLLTYRSIILIFLAALAALHLPLVVIGRRTTTLEFGHKH